MNTIRTDVCVLGAGTAGLNARREVEKAGKHWVMVESGPYGTTCARVGCMPSKLLVAAADAAYDAHHAARFGVHTDVRIDGREVMARVRRERDRFAGFVVADTEALPADQRVHGTARFVAPTVLEVDDHTRIEAGAVVIATGSAPWFPPGLDAVRDRLMVNDDVFDLVDLPGSVAVLGAGVIGMELGQALHRLGVRVHVFSPMESLLGLSDPAVYAAARGAFEDELDLHLGTAATLAPEGDGVAVSWSDDGGAHTVHVERVLVAAGRRPRVAGLGLEHLGVTLESGVPVHDVHTMQVADLPVFLAGDVSGDRPLLHEAGDEGRIAGANAACFPEVSPHHRRTPIAVAFTDPQVAVVGASFRDLDPATTATGAIDYAHQGRARVLGRGRGLVHIYADRTCHRLLGATLFAPRAEHMAHLLAWAVASELTVNETLERPFYHPVLEEGLRTALRDLAKELKTMSQAPPEDWADCPGS